MQYLIYLVKRNNNVSSLNINYMKSTVALLLCSFWTSVSLLVCTQWNKCGGAQREHFRLIAWPALDYYDSYCNVYEIDRDLLYSKVTIFFRETFSFSYNHRSHPETRDIHIYAYFTLLVARNNSHNSDFGIHLQTKCTCFCTKRLYKTDSFYMNNINKTAEERWGFPN